MKNIIPTQEQVIEYVKKHYSNLGLSTGDEISASSLGHGERNYNFLVVIDGNKFVFRTPMKRDNFKLHEVNILRFLSKEFAPEVIYNDTSLVDFPLSVTILSFIEGNTQEKWEKHHLALHARKLAKLHEITANYCEVNGKKREKLDMVELFKDDVNHFINDIKAQERVQPYIPSILSYLEKNNFYFLELREFSFIHSDPLLPNILFDAGEIHYIDWEWAHYSDPAKDVSLCYYKEHDLLPWMIRLTDEDEQFYLDTYLSEREDETLKERVKVWHVVYRFIDYLYFLKKIENWDQSHNQMSIEHYQGSVEKMESYFKQYFGGD